MSYSSPIGMEATTTFVATGILTFFLIGLWWQSTSQKESSSQIPYLNSTGEASLSRDPIISSEFVTKARQLLLRGRKLFSGKPYQIQTTNGDTIILPSSLAHDIRNEKSLSFREAFAENFYPHLQGFDGFAAGYREDELLQRVVKKWITKLLSKYS